MQEYPGLKHRPMRNLKSFTVSCQLLKADRFGAPIFDASLHVIRRAK